MIQILNDQGVKYKTFDILQDEEVRQGILTLIFFCYGFTYISWNVDSAEKVLTQKYYSNSLKQIKTEFIMVFLKSWKKTHPHLISG